MVAVISTIIAIVFILLKVWNDRPRNYWSIWFNQHYIICTINAKWSKHTVPQKTIDGITSIYPIKKAPQRGFVVSIWRLASSNPFPTMHWYPQSSKYAIQSLCSGDTVPPFWRFISTHIPHAGMNKSGTPGLTPSALNFMPCEPVLAPPLGIAKIRVSGYVFLNHATSLTCSRCSEGKVSTRWSASLGESRAALKMEVPIPTRHKPQDYLQILMVVPRWILRIRHLCCNGHKYGKPGGALLWAFHGIGWHWRVQDDAYCLLITVKNFPSRLYSIVAGGLPSLRTCAISWRSAKP